MSFRTLLTEAEEWMLYNITDPENMIIRGHGYQKKKPFKSEAEARKATPRDGEDGFDKDYIAIKVSDYIKKFKKTKLEENEIKTQALEEMRNIQAQLGGISFISVIGVMREDNPLKEEVFQMENMLHELTVTVSQFINDNLPDAVETTDDEREDNVDKAVKDAEDQEEIEKKSPQKEEE